MKTRTQPHAKRLLADAVIVLTGLWIAAAGFSGGDIAGGLSALILFA